MLYLAPMPGRFLLCFFIRPNDGKLHYNFEDQPFQFLLCPSFFFIKCLFKMHDEKPVPEKINQIWHY